MKIFTIDIFLQGQFSDKNLFPAEEKRQIYFSDNEIKFASIIPAVLI